MKLSTDQQGLEAFFEEWQVELIERLQSGIAVTSRIAHEYLKEKNVKTTSSSARGTVSRASVINFLNKLVDEGFLSYTEGTGKGGYHRIYVMELSKEQFAHRILGLFVGKLIEVFPEESKTFMWPRP